MSQATHNKIMENQNKVNSTKRNKKSNPMKKIGKTIKDTFIEMSSSLAGWIDDTGAHFSGKKKKSTTNKNSATASKTTMPKSSSHKIENN